ncbi:Pfs NACHT and ankyrin domain-containing protein [Penicillium odoratum]|uniref:Pfs NACHT and ankyrin domain-containing protein n=1 Tax=Penicillium odoratum TaxID=1167516 RepID=UPI0025470124|nr:Pfs NACHT and ankyrin domain-containing protein [Penicillium odoratum]KAJ5765631.1 Pfs NACHT and ankyrin domain-containing protein [Penicillium odoratum]
MVAPPLGEFKVGWICATSVGAAVARIMLDEIFGFLDEQDSTDINQYVLGRIDKHYVVIASVPDRNEPTSASIVVANMLRTFSSSLRIGLIVGVGGGIPSEKSDIRLGDIVVGSPQENSSGVVQYQMKEVDERRELAQTGSLYSTPRPLLNAITNMRTTWITDFEEYPEYLKAATERNGRTRKRFGRPDSSDRLFKTEYQHSLTEKTCDRCLPEWEVIRDEREDTVPKIHFGVIASGNPAMKDDATRDVLQKETDALCFETEAAGLLEGFPCIVIRGICDYCDSHKNEEWQDYAALAAASYAKEVLKYVSQVQISKEKLVVDIIPTQF